MTIVSRIRQSSAKPTEDHDASHNDCYAPPNRPFAIFDPALLSSRSMKAALKPSKRVEDALGARARRHLALY
jgi:hypothetical protein